MKRIWRTFLWILRQIIGWGFILLGVAGIILPGLPGWIFIALGVLLLADDVAMFRRLIEKVEQKWPQTHGTLHRARSWLGHRQPPIKTQPCSERPVEGQDPEPSEKAKS